MLHWEFSQQPNISISLELKDTPLYYQKLIKKMLFRNVGTHLDEIFRYKSATGIGTEDDTETFQSYFNTMITVSGTKLCRNST